MMPMNSIDLGDHAWHEIADFDQTTAAPIVQITGDNAGSVVAAFSVAEPGSSTPTFLMGEGFFSLPIPADKTLWVKCLTGDATATYSQAEPGGWVIYVWNDSNAWEILTDASAPGYVTNPPEDPGLFVGQTAYGTVSLEA